SLSGTGGDWQLSQYPPNPILWRCPYSRAPPDLTRYLRALEPAAQPQAELPAVIGHRRDRRARPPQRSQISRMHAAVEKVGDLEEQLQLAAPRTQGIAGKQIQLRVGAGKGVEAEPVRPAERFRLVVDRQRRLERVVVVDQRAVDREFGSAEERRAAQQP